MSVLAVPLDVCVGGVSNMLTYLPAILADQAHTPF